MKRLFFTLLALVLATAGLVSAPSAQAVGEDDPVVQSPADRAVFWLGDTVDFRVDFFNAPTGAYRLQIASTGGASIYDGYHDNATDGDTAEFRLLPSSPGNYTFTVSASVSSAPYARTTFAIKRAVETVVIERPSSPATRELRLIARRCACLGLLLQAMVEQQSPGTKLRQAALSAISAPKTVPHCSRG